MTTLSELRDYVRSQTQTTSSELPDAVLDDFLQEAYNRTIAHENRWPFFQKTWDLTLSAGATTMALPGDVSQPGITALRSVEDRTSFDMMDHVSAEELFGYDQSATTRPIRWSLWEDTIYLWPAVDYATDKAYKLTGYRLPSDWISAGASSEPDCDPRMHRCLAHFAIALAYQQQEDEQLADYAMQRWWNDFEIIHRQIMLPPRQRPAIFGKRFISPIGGRRGGLSARAIVDTSGL